MFAHDTCFCLLQVIISAQLFSERFTDITLVYCENRICGIPVPYYNDLFPENATLTVFYFVIYACIGVF